MAESEVTRRSGRKYQDWKIEEVEVTREDPEADADKIRRCLAGLIARKIAADQWGA